VSEAALEPPGCQERQKTDTNRKGAKAQRKLKKQIILIFPFLYLCASAPLRFTKPFLVS
jgi:hypothetical protein